MVVEALSSVQSSLTISGIFVLVREISSNDRYRRNVTHLQQAKDPQTLGVGLKHH